MKCIELAEGNSFLATRLGALDARMLVAFALATARLTEKGYKRFWSEFLRGQYEHRVVAEIAWGPRLPFPKKMDVHHMDGKRSRNCRENLLILPECLHLASSNRRKGVRK